jgi:hypothetical protein
MSLLLEKLVVFNLSINLMADVGESVVKVNNSSLTVNTDGIIIFHLLHQSVNVRIGRGNGLGGNINLQSPAIIQGMSHTKRCSLLTNSSLFFFCKGGRLEL